MSQSDSPILSSQRTPYRCMVRHRIADNGFELRPLGSCDIEPIRRWRNAQMDVLRQSEVIGPQQQVEYFQDCVWPEKSLAKPSKVLLAYLKGEALIGYGGLVHIDWSHNRAELSFLLCPKLEEKRQLRAEYFAKFLEMMQEVAFRDLGLARLFTETYATRTQHIRTLESSGFVLEGRLRHHVVVHGIPTDALFHGVLQAEWSAKGAR